MKETDEKQPNPERVGQAIEHCFEALTQSDVYFGHGTDNAWDEAVQLVLSAADLPADADQTVLDQPLLAAQVETMLAWLQRRINERVPLPYLTGRVWFAGLEFICDSRAIIPRSPLAELMLADYQPWYTGPGPATILDLCCGGGCIGLAAACHAPAAQVDLVDLDPDALGLAQENRRLLGLAERVNIQQSNLFDALKGRRYDLILSNPPYVDEGDLGDMPAEYHHEPELALGSGRDGLALTRRILAEAEHYLNESGLLVVEVGNSWEALEEVYPDVAFTWLEFEQGGHGVFVLTAQELRDYRESLKGLSV